MKADTGMAGGSLGERLGQRSSSNQGAIRRACKAHSMRGVVRGSCQHLDKMERQGMAMAHRGPGVIRGIWGQLHEQHQDSPSRA